MIERRCSFLVVSSGKPFGEVEAHLVAEHRQRADAGAVLCATPSSRIARAGRDRAAWPDYAGRGAASKRGIAIQMLRQTDSVRLAGVPTRRGISAWPCAISVPNHRYSSPPRCARRCFAACFAGCTRAKAARSPISPDRRAAPPRARKAAGRPTRPSRCARSSPTRPARQRRASSSPTTTRAAIPARARRTVAPRASSGQRGAALGIALHDHLIFAGGDCRSFRRLGLL